jgi:hypothetical protein
MPTYPNPAGGSMQAANDADARSKGWTPSMGTFGVNTYPDSSGGGGGGSAGGGGGVAAPAATVQSGASQLGAGINSLLGAIASGNKQAFDEAVRQFNATFGLDTDKFNESVRQYNEGLAVTQAGLTGTYQGQETQQAQMQAANIAAQVAGLTGYYNAPAGVAAAGPGGTAAPTAASYVQARTAQLQQVAGMNPTQAAQTAQAEWSQGLAQAGNIAYGLPAGISFAPVQAAAGGVGGAPQGTPTMAYQEQTYRQQLDAINAAAALQASPFRQQQVIGQLGRVLGGQGVAGFSAPNTVAGVGTAGGNTAGGMGYMQQMIDDIRAGTNSANSQSMNDVLNGIPTPNKINSQDFLRSPASTQNFLLQGMQERYGLDPADSLAQIKNTLPQFVSPTTFGTIKG